jgi:hypothetical protein
MELMICIESRFVVSVEWTEIGPVNDICCFGGGKVDYLACTAIRVIFEESVFGFGSYLSAAHPKPHRSLVPAGLHI